MTTTTIKKVRRRRRERDASDELWPFEIPTTFGLLNVKTTQKLERKKGEGEEIDGEEGEPLSGKKNKSEKLRRKT